MTLSWKSQALISRKACGQIWPKIVQLRAELRTWELAHGYFELMRLEAERRLTPVMKLPPSATAKGPEKKAETLLAKASKLSPEQKKELILALEGRRR